MPSMMYGSAAYDRTTGGLPPLKLINMFVEKAPTSENQIALQSRPGLSTSYTVGAGPIAALAVDDSGTKLAVSGGTLYANTTSKGAITGGLATTIAVGQGESLITAQGNPYSYTTSLAFAGFTGNSSNLANSVCFINERFVVLEAGSGRFFWSGLLNGRSWDVLNFATAERQPDNALDIAALGDNIWIYGQRTLEIWQNDGVTPFSRIEQVTFDKGIITTGARTRADNTEFFVGSDAKVYRASTDVPQRISDHWLEEKIAASSYVSMFSFIWQGHEFVCLKLFSQVFAYDCATEAWCEFQSSGGPWLAQCAAMNGDTALLGHNSTGAVMVFSGWQDLSAAMTRQFTAAVQMDEPGSIDNVWLWAETGTALTVTCEHSRDAGESWVSAGDATVTSGARQIAEWRRLGEFDAPGAMFRFTTTSNAPFRVSAVKYNEPLGGRSRN